MTRQIGTDGFPFLFSQDPGFVDDAFYSTAREIAEIEALIPEIREKIDDTNDMLIEEAKRCQEIDEQENMITKIADKEKNIQNGSTKGKLFSGYLAGPFNFH